MADVQTSRGVPVALFLTFKKNLRSSNTSKSKRTRYANYVYASLMLSLSRHLALKDKAKVRIILLCAKNYVQKTWAKQKWRHKNFVFNHNCNESIAPTEWTQTRLSTAQSSMIHKTNWMNLENRKNIFRIFALRKAQAASATNGRGSLPVLTRYRNGIPTDNVRVFYVFSTGILRVLCVEMRRKCRENP